MENNSFDNPGGSGYLIWAEAEHQLNITFKRNICVGDQFGLRFDEPLASADIDENVYYKSASDPYYFRLNGTIYNGLSAWQAATSYDANSVELNPGYADTLNEDFSTTAPEVAALQAGAEHYTPS